MDTLVDEAIVDGEVIVAPSDIMEWSKNLDVGDKVEIDFGGYGITVYKESIKGLSSYRIVQWEVHPDKGEPVRRHDHEWKHFRVDGDSTFGANLYNAFRVCDLDPEGIEFRKGMNDA